MKSIQEHFSNGSNIQDAAVKLHSLYILSKVQINQVNDVSQKVTLHHPNSLIKAMYFLFNYNGNRAWFAHALS